MIAQLEMTQRTTQHVPNTTPPHTHTQRKQQPAAESPPNGRWGRTYIQLAKSPP